MIMRLRPSSACLLAGLAWLLPGCATLMHSDHQSVRIFSTPSDAKVVVDDLYHLTTIGTVNLSRLENHTAVFEKDGYEPATVKIERYMSQWIWWNIFCGPGIYWCVKSDLDQGGFYTFDDDIHVTLKPRAGAAASQPPTP
jgi:hypothetical protein